MKELTLNTIYNEECLKGMEKIPDKSVDMILCDLPYGTTQNKWDSVIPFELLWKQYNRIIKDNGAIVLTAQPPFDKVLGTSNLKHLRYEWIWEKNIATGHLNAKKMPLKKTENILVFYKKLPTYNAQGLIERDIIHIRKGRDNGTNYGASVKDSPSHFTNYPNNLIRFNGEKGLHPTQKPVALFEYLIKTYTNPGETVLDNCMGSGTTAIACQNTGRNFIGFELDADYHRLSIERVEKNRKELEAVA